MTKKKLSSKHSIYPHETQIKMCIILREGWAEMSTEKKELKTQAFIWGLRITIQMAQIWVGTQTISCQRKKDRSFIGEKKRERESTRFLTIGRCYCSLQGHLGGSGS